MLDMLAVDGVIYAFQKQLAAEAGTLRLIVEYCDVNSAARAVSRLNGTVIRVSACHSFPGDASDSSFQAIQISADFHKPDLKSSPTRHHLVLDTPTRGQDEFSDAFAEMSLASPTHAQYPVMPPTYATFLSPTGRTLMPAQYPLSPTYTGIPMTYGTRFSPLNNSIAGLSVSGVSLSPSCTGNQSDGCSEYPSLPPSFYVGSPSRVPSSSSQPGRLSRSGSGNPGRQHLVKSGSRGSYGTSQSGQHNVVDIGKIRDGIDVRTTVSLCSAGIKAR